MGATVPDIFSDTTGRCASPNREWILIISSAMAAISKWMSFTNRIPSYKVVDSLQQHPFPASYNDNVR